MLCSPRVYGKVRHWYTRSHDFKRPIAGVTPGRLERQPEADLAGQWRLAHGGLAVVQVLPDDVGRLPDQQPEVSVDQTYTTNSSLPIAGTLAPRITRPARRKSSW